MWTRMVHQLDYRLWLVKLLLAVLYAVHAPILYATTVKSRAPKNQKKQAVSISPTNQGAKSNATSSQPKKLSGSALYQKAREYFAAGRYVEAIQYGAAAQRRVPGSKAPTVLVAQSYYRMGKVARAAKLFLQIPLQELPREAGIDYLLTMFATRRYIDVVKSYAIIPENNPYRDVAKFYVGSSLLQLRHYQKASKVLRSAKKIPASLKSERRKLLAVIRQEQQRERQGQLSGSPLYYNVPQTSYLPPPVEAEPVQPTLPGGVPSKPAPAKPEPPKSGVSFLAAAAFDMSVKSVREDFNGYLLKQSDNQTPKFTLDFGLLLLGEPRSFGGQPSLDIGFTPSQSYSEGRTSTSKLTASEDDPTNVQNQATRTESKSDSLSQDFSVVGLMPISEPIDIGANFGLNNTTTKSPSKSERTVTSFGGNIKGDYDLIDFDLSHSLSTSTTKGDNTKSESSTSKIAITYAGEESTTSLSAAMSSFKPKSGVTATTDLGINWSKELTIFGEEFGIDLGASSSEKTRVPLSAEGSILKQMALKLELDHSFGAGLTGSLTTNFIQIGSLPVLKDDTISDGPPEVLATGDAKQFILLFKYAPVSFAAASVAYDYTDRMLRVSDQNFKLKLLKNNFGQRTVTSINLSLNYKF